MKKINNKTLIESIILRETRRRRENRMIILVIGFMLWGLVIYSYQTQSVKAQEVKNEVSAQFSRKNPPSYVNKEDKKIPIACWNSKTNRIRPLTSRRDCYITGGGGHNILSLPISQWEAWWDATNGNIGIITNSLSTPLFESNFRGKICRKDKAGNCADYGYMQINFIHNCIKWTKKPKDKTRYFVFGNKICKQWGDWNRFEARTFDIYQSIKWYLNRRRSLKKRFCYKGGQDKIVNCLARLHNGNSKIKYYGYRAMKVAQFYRKML